MSQERYPAVYVNKKDNLCSLISFSCLHLGTMNPGESKKGKMKSSVGTDVQIVSNIYK